MQTSSPRRWWPRRWVALVALTGITAAAAACSPVAGGPPASIAPSGNPRPSSAATASAPVASASAAPVAPSASLVLPGTVAAEIAPRLLWKGRDPSGPGTPSVGQIAFGPDGRIWVSATKLNVFWIFEPSGRFVEAWGTPGDGEGEFDFARDGTDSFGAVAFAPDRSLYVADTGHRRVEQFDASRRFLGAFGEFGSGDGQFVSPSAIGVGPSGHVFVLDDARQVVQEFTSDGEFVRAFGGGHGPSMAVSPAGHILLVDQDRRRLDEYANGIVVRSIDLTGLINFGNGLAVPADGTIWVASEIGNGPLPTPDQVLELGTDGRLLHRWPVAAEAIAVDPATDRLYANFFPQPELEAYDLPGLAP